MRTNFPVETGDSDASDTVLTQETPESESKMKFPMRIKYRGRVLAKIYAKTKAYPLYRVAWTVSGKRLMKAFERYGGENGAKPYADNLVKDLAKGSQATALTAGQASDALAALDRLRNFYTSTGRKVSLLCAASEYIEAASKLTGRTLGEAVEGYLRTVASVKRKDICEAVEEFIAADEPRTKANDGKRAQLSAKYAYNRAIMLRRFASTFPNTAVSELGKEHLDTFIGAKPVSDFSAKSRNHHRAAIRQLLAWAVRRDYLSPTHRLGEATGLQPENGNTSEILFYTPAEFKALLETAQGPMRAMIALGGLAGLRTAELLRLSWEDTRRVEGHIEITAGKSKTRQRRLVEICPALAQWLAQFSSFSGKIWEGHEITWQQNFCRVCDKAEFQIKPGQNSKVTRKPNGLRHAFVTYHFALHSNENLTAAVAGNTPQMIHQHYRGLAKKTEAEKWFAVAPDHAANIVQFAAAQNQ